jgi:hypothetical protein
MTDAYSQFCRRKAAQFAELEALEKEEQTQTAKTPQRRSSAALVYKTFYGGTPEPQSQQEIVMSAQQQKPWDEWADARIARFLAENPFSETQRETLGVVIAEIRRELREEFERQLAAREEKMNDELAALRVADAITRSLIGGRGNVLPIDDTIVRKNLKSDTSLEIEEAKKQDVA